MPMDFMKGQFAWKLPEKDYLEEASRFLRKAKSFRRRYLEKWRKPEIFREALIEYERMMEESDFEFFLGLEMSVNLENPDLKRISGRVSAISNQISDTLRFFEEGIPRLSRELQREMIEECPEYRNFLSMEFATGKYLLPEYAEKVSERLSRPAWGNWERMVSELVSSETISGKTLPELLSDQTSRNARKREAATRKANKILEKYSRVSEHELNSILETKSRMDELRGYRYPEEARLVSDQIPRRVVEEMMEDVRRLFRLSRKYYEWKSQQIGGMKYSWRAVPVVEMGKIKEGEMFNEVRKVFYETGFPEHVDYFLDGRIDLYPRKGKRGGAFCAAHGPKTDVYVLMNFTGRMEDAFTLAHELGHGLHDMLMRKQTYLNYGSPLPLAETASTFFEQLLGERMDRKGVKERMVDSDMATVFRQAAAFLFEKELHMRFRKSGYLTREDITEMMNKHMREYLGDVEMDMPYFWVAWSHFRSPFYVYSYVFGHLLSLGLLKDYLESGDFSRVRRILEAGSSVPPMRLLRRNFWKDGLRIIKKRVAEVVG